MKRTVVVVFSLVSGYLLGTAAAVALIVVRLHPARLARTYSEYSTYSAAVMLVLMIFFSWAMYQVLARRFLGRKVDTRPYLERLPSWARQPSVPGLAITWVVAVCTVLPYPLAIYMSWRFYTTRHEQSKACPRCAERIRAAALVCKHCGHALDGQVAPQAAAPA